MKTINVLGLAAYVYEKYAKENNGETIDEMKMHKLLYFIQRENLIRYDKPLFAADFFARKFGPILHEIHTAYENNSIITTELPQLTAEQEVVIDYVFTHYSHKNSWSLSRLTRGQISWKKARAGISEYANSNVLMSVEDIRADAKAHLDRRIKLQSLELASPEL